MPKINRRLWLSAAGVVALLLTISGATMGLGRLTIGGATSRSPSMRTLRQPASTPTFGAGLPAQADALTVEVTQSGYRISPGVVFARTLHDPALIARVRNYLESTMPQVIGPGTDTSCPAYPGPIAYAYVLRFYTSGALVELSTGDSMNDCQFWTIQTRDTIVVRCCPGVLLSAYQIPATAPFWTLLHQETGAPLPPVSQPT